MPSNDGKQDHVISEEKWNSAIAKKIFGLSVLDRPFSTNLMWAWKIVEWFSERHCSVTVTQLWSSTCHVTIEHGGTSWTDYFTAEAYATTVPRAICMAALNASNEWDRVRHRMLQQSSARGAELEASIAE